MSGDEEITHYMRRVASALRLPKRERGRAVEEIRNHLDDGIAAHMREGSTRQQATALAVADLGQPDVVAAAFNDGGARGSDVAGVRRWLPLVPPVALFIVAAVLLVWSVTWLADGWTVGERTAQHGYLVAALVTGGLSVGAYVSITRSEHDAAWRWGAWLSAGIALAMVAASAF